MAVCQVMIKKGRICTKEYLVDPAHIIPNVIPRLLPRFSLTAMENSLHGCEVLSGWRSGKKGTSFPRMLLLACNYTCINTEAPQPPGNDMTTSRQSAFMFSYVILPDICGQLPSGKDRPSHTPAPTETAKSLGISGLISKKCERSNNLWWGPPIPEMHLLYVQSGESHTNLLAHADIIEPPLSPGPWRSQNPIQVYTYMVHLSFHWFMFMLWKQLWGKLCWVHHI